MSQRWRKGAALVGGILAWLIGVFPDSGWELLTRIFRGASDHPIRATFAVIGTALVLYAFWNPLLDILGIQTKKRLQSDVRTWLDTFQFSVKKIPNPNAYFEFQVSAEHGGPFVVGNFRDREHYLWIIGGARIADEDKAVYDSLPVYEQNVISSNAIMELCRTSAAYNVDLPNNKIEVSKRIPITALNEHVLMTSIDEMSNARSVFGGSFGYSMAQARKRLEDDSDKHKKDKPPR